MDAVAREVEPNPDASDRVVGTGLYDELLSDAFASCGRTKYRRVKCVIRFGHSSLNFQLSARALIDSSGYTDGAVEAYATFGIDCL